MHKFKNAVHRLFCCFVVFLLSAHAFSQSSEQPVAGKKNVPVIELSGDAYSRGLQHGRLLKNDIEAVFKKWKENIAVNTKQNADSIIAHFYNATNFLPAIKRWTPGIYDELRGMAKGSEQSFKDMYCFQLLDEFWVYIDQLENISLHHCSGIGIAASGSHPAYVAQNMDVENFMNGYQVLLHIAAFKNEPEQYILSCAGLLALNGVNSKSIGVCVNTLMDLKASSDGLPVVCVIRGILSKQSREAVLTFVQNVKHASGQNYIIGAIDSVYDFEAAAGKVVRFLPLASNTSLVYHTNHAIVNDYIKPWYRDVHKQILGGGITDDNSVVRFTALQQRLNPTTGELSDAVVKETLRSKDDLKNPVCRRYTNGGSVFTFSSVLLTLGKTPSIQVTNASPDRSEYILHDFKGKQ